jgi:ankyrin repeat protein
MQRRHTHTHTQTHTHTHSHTHTHTHTHTQVRQCLKLGASVNTADGLGRTALHYAARSAINNESNSRVLIDHGADVNCQDHDGWTALAHACFNGRAAVVRLLLRRGANLELQA